MVSSCRQGDLALLQLLWNATLNLAHPPTTSWPPWWTPVSWIHSVPPGACVMVFCISSFTTSRKSPMACQGPKSGHPDSFSHPASLQNTVFLWKKSILTGKNTIEININSDPTRLTAAVDLCVETPNPSPWNCLRRLDPARPGFESQQYLISWEEVKYFIWCFFVWNPILFD